MDLVALGRVLLAAALSLPVGLDREFRGKAAGLRTHVVVATACAALGYLSVASVGDSPVADRTRIAAQVVTGIGFMGAGVIFASGDRVHGLTTAAALFSAATTGLCVGMGAYGLGVALVLVTAIFLGPVDWISDRLIGERVLEERTIRLVASDVAALARVQEVIGRHDVTLRGLKLGELGNAIGVRMILRCRHATVVQIVDELEEQEGVALVFDHWRNRERY